MKKTATILMIIAILSKILGFARDITLSYFYGASTISDAYLISETIPLTIFGLIGAGISTGYIPIYSKIESEYGLEEGNKYTNILVNILIVICTIVIILGVSFTDRIVKVFAAGFKGEQLALAIQFTRISLMGIYFSTLNYIFNGFLQIKKNYIIPSLISFPFNFFVILAIFISYRTDINVFIIGNVIAIASQLFLTIPFAYKLGYRYRLTLDLKNKHIKSMLYIALPVIIGVSVNQINTLVDRTIASQIATGGISALSYAGRLNGFIQGIFVLSTSTVLYPMIAKMAVEKNILGLKQLVSEAINSINLFVLPATIGSMVFAEQIITLLFGRGQFDSAAIHMTSYALFFYSIGMVGFGLREVLSRTFYSLQDTKTPMINAMIAMSINIILNIILSKFLGIGGLALATSVSGISCTLLLFINIRKKIGSFGTNNIFISFLKILCASLLMGLIAKLTYNTLLSRISSTLSLIFSIVAGIIVYFIIIYFMRVGEVNTSVELLKRKIKSWSGVTNK